jgi:parallel beta-helix repeat protein
MVRTVKILSGLFMLVFLVVMSSASGRAQVTCDITVTGNASIQSAVNSAVAGQTVCLSGTFSGQMVVLTAANSGITITAAPGGTAVLDGHSATPTRVGSYVLLSAFALDNGASDITIEGLEMEFYNGGDEAGVGNGVTAWAVSTSNITVQNNYIHDNSWDAVMVGSEGDTTHTGWVVRNNTATSNSAYQIELTNCSGCSAQDNTVTGGTIGILVQARNTTPNSGLVTVRGVSVKNNTVDGAYYGAYIVAEAMQCCFYPISDAYATLQAVSFTGNHITSSGDAGVASVVVGGKAGTSGGTADTSYGGPAAVVNPSLVKNTFDCGGSGYAINLFNSTVNAKVVNDSVTECTDLVGPDSGTNTKIPSSLGSH